MIFFEVSSVSLFKYKTFCNIVLNLCDVLFFWCPVTWLYICKTYAVEFFFVSLCAVCIRSKCQCVIYSSMVSVMGKVEGQGESWHGHVTAVTVSPEYRRQQLAKKLMNLLEDVSDKM